MILADSEFRGLISTKHTSDILDVFEDVLCALERVNPRLYRNTLERIADL